MTKSGPPKKRRKVVAENSFVPPVSELRGRAKEETKKHLHAEATDKNYDGHIRRAKEFTRKQVEGEREEMQKLADRGEHSEDDDQREARQELGEDWDVEQFALAWENPPNEYSGRALQMFLMHKCIYEGCSVQTAEQARAAAIRYWNQMDGDRYRGERWEWDAERKQGKGNPARTAEIDDLMKMLKNRSHLNGGDRHHSMAMTAGNMKKIIEWSESACSPGVLGKPFPVQGDIKEFAITYKHLFMRAFATSGFTLWTRNFELSGLKYKNLIMNQTSSPHYIDHFKVRLTNRKGWQRRLDAEGVLRGHVYDIYLQKEVYHIDMYTHFLVWVEFLEGRVYKRSLEPEDLLFPSLSSNGVVQLGIETSHETIQRWITEFALAAGLKSTTGGTFTTHCFRRGGAQYRFMECPIHMRWPIAKIRWWGGWAEGEPRDTLMKYLMDELTTYEQDFSDALCPVQRHANESQMGNAALLGPLTMANAVELFQAQEKRNEQRFGQFTNQINQSILALTQTLCFGSATCRPYNQLPTSQPTLVGPGIPPIPLLPLSAHVRTTGFNMYNIENLLPSCLASGSKVTVMQQPSGDPFGAIASHTDVPIYEQEPASSLAEEPALCIPRLPHRNPCMAWRVAVRQWFDGDPAKGLTVPLKDWKAEWYQRGSKGTAFASLRSQRQTIAEEFRARSCTEDEFETEIYPQAKKGITQLLEAIRTAKKERGEIHGRVRK